MGCEPSPKLCSSPWYLAAAAEKYKLEYRTARADLEIIETAIEAVIEYAFRHRQDLSLPPMSQKRVYKD